MNRHQVVYDLDWENRYAVSVATPEQAVERLKPGQRIFVGTGAAQPHRLVCALLDRSAELPDVQIIQLVALGHGPYPYAELRRHYNVTSFFVAVNLPEFTREGLRDYTPLFVSALPRLFDSSAVPLDAALIQVTPPDERGVVSLGPSVDIVKSAAANAGLVIAQVNPNQPWTEGDTLLDIEDIDVLVPASEPLAETPPPRSDEITRRIGEYVAALVEDGSTFAVGLGATPQAALSFLREKKDLGVHTEVLVDGILDLVEAGAVNGRRKTRDRGHVVASFCLGSRRLYEAIDRNPVFHLHPTEYVNDVTLMTQQERMVSINGALEVDLTGQVAADSGGIGFLVGIGGQVDFSRGAAGSPGGKAIFALSSTGREGSVSRIVAHLSPGAGVVATRGDVHYVVTEYGAAYLYGKSVQQRSLALITVAHPDFRVELLAQAIEAGYVREELAYVGGRIGTGPRELRTSLLLEDGTKVGIRPIEPTDEPNMQDLFYALSRQSVYLRFMQFLKRMPQKQIQDFVYIDHRNEVSIVATLPSPGGDEIIAVAGYYLDPKTNRAEVAFVVRDQWQHRGIGSFLLRHLVVIAKRNGIAGFFGEALVENRPMQAVLRNSGCHMRSRVESGVFVFELDF